jgi:hypothetical protein
LDTKFLEEETLSIDETEKVTPSLTQTQKVMPTLTETVQPTSTVTLKSIIELEKVDLNCGFPCLFGMEVGKTTRQEVINFFEEYNQSYQEGDRCAPFCYLEAIVPYGTYSIYLWFDFSADNILTQLTIRVFPYKNVEVVQNLWPERLLLDNTPDWFLFDLEPLSGEGGDFYYWLVMGFDELNMAVHYSASSNISQNGYLTICPSFQDAEAGLDWLQLFYYPSTELMRSREGVEADNENLQIAGVDLTEIIKCEEGSCSSQCIDVLIESYNQEE